MKIKGSLEGMFLIQRELEHDEEDYFQIVKNEKDLNEIAEDGDYVCKLEKVPYLGTATLKLNLEK